jgi:hypothetical protein
MDTLLTGTAFDFEANLHRVVPELSEEELHQCGRAIRRSMCAALLDKSVEPDELRDEMHMIIDGYVARSGRASEVRVEASVGTGAGGRLAGL